MYCILSTQHDISIRLMEGVGRGGDKNVMKAKIVVDVNTNTYQKAFQISGWSVSFEIRKWYGRPGIQQNI